MAYSFMRIEKIKTYGGMNSRYKHNLRKASVENADPDRSDLNEHLIPMAERDGQPVSYEEAFKERIKDLPYYKEHKIRPGQVLGYEVYLGFSKDDGLNLEQWKFKSVEWLQNTFNVAKDGKPNVINIEYHADETTPHIHAFVIPVDERGHLNATRFTNGSKALSGLQTSYAKDMEELGLKRGLKGSSARHEQIRKMYADLNNVMKIPEVQEGETAEEYRDRVVDTYETISASRKKSADDYAVKKRRDTDEYVIRRKEEIGEEREAMLRDVREETKDAKKERDRAKEQAEQYREEAESYHRHMQELADQMFEIRNEMSLRKEQEAKAIMYDDLMEGVEIISQEDYERGQRIRSDIQEASGRGARERTRSEQKEMER